MNRNIQAPKSPPTLVALLRWRAYYQPDQRGYVFLAPGEAEETHLSYGELDRGARTIAALLQDRGLAGERALLLYPPSLAYMAAFFGCLYAGVVAVPVYPPDPARLARTLPRLEAIARDACAQIVVTTSTVRAMAQSLFPQGSDFAQMHWFTTDDLTGDLADTWREPGVETDSVAFLQYTSGSTAAPKGVMLSHGNLLHNLRLIQQAFTLTADDCIVSWLPPYHDMGLIGGILEALYSGIPSILFSPVDFLKRPFRWLQAISRYRATVSGAPNFAYDLCVRKVTPEQKATLDLSAWTLAFNGAEPVRADSLQRFTETFAPCGFQYKAFYPCYGLAEATLLASKGRRNAPPVVQAVQPAAMAQGRAITSQASDASRLVGCGQSLPGQQIMIVDPETLTACTPGQIGEIWLAGASVAQGYWRQPQETERTFQAFLAGTEAGPFLRTGDLGFIQDQQLFVTGRLKDLLIFHGYNHYPQDIENTVAQCCPGLRPGCSAAFSIDLAGEERLVIVAEVDRNFDLSQAPAAVSAIRQAVGEQHQVAVYAVSLLAQKTIHKTSSGKIQRHACREEFLAGSLKHVWEWRESPPPSSPASISDTVAFPHPEPGQRESIALIQDWLVSRLATRLNRPRETIDVRQPFASFGLDSVAAVGITGELEHWLERPFPATLLYEYPTIQSLAHTLATGSDHQPAAIPSPPTHEPIAITGIGCRFPGANTPAALWQLLRDGVDAIAEVPADRWDWRAFYDPHGETPGKANTRWGGFLDQVDSFDPYFFNISPREAAAMDPQQRLLLELSWEALEDAALPPGRLAGTGTGVFIGIASHDYADLHLQDFNQIDAHTGTGSALSIAANRLSYWFDLRGPSIAVDTACSASLVAVHLACHSLWRGESTLALAGGVNLVLSPAVTINFTKAGLMAPDGRCKAFDARADGYVRGEGGAIVVLKPLSQALADGDPIYAVIRGSAVGHDGRSNGLMAPSRQAQETVLHTAYRQAGVSPGQVQYVEAHGTGTFLGDPVEAKALNAVLAGDRRPEDVCALGSIKTNIGHLEAAAGIAGLIKVALSLHHRLIPASLHFEEPNPHIPFADRRLRVQQKTGPWPDETRPLLAGVSSLGFGGANAHVVLAEAPRPAPATQGPESAVPESCLLPLSAHSPVALRDLIRAYRDFWGAGDAPSWPDVCYTASVRRHHHDYRCALVAPSAAELVGQLDAWLQAEEPGDKFHRVTPGSRPKIAFVFPGQGSQWIGMGRQLLAQEPVFAEALDRCQQALRPYTEGSIEEQLRQNVTPAQLEQTDIIQPMLFAIQVSLAALWRSWGIIPDAVMGQSMGEIAAAHVAGALNLAEAARIICRRSQVVQRQARHGGMAVVELSPEQAQAVVDRYTGRVSIAVYNNPRSTVLAGEPAALAEILDRLQRQHLFGRQIKVKYASHSHYMAPLRHDLLSALDGVQPARATVPFYSTVTGSVENGRELTAGYWVQNLCQPVLFWQALQQLAAADHTVFVEISPHPVLLPVIEQGLRCLDQKGVSLPSMRHEAPRGERATLLESLGKLYTLGYPVAWAGLYPAGGRPTRLPAYPWQRERYWLDEATVRPSRPVAGTTGRSSLGHYLQSAIHPDTYFWQMTLSPHSFPYLGRHLVGETAVLPAAAYVELILAAATQVWGKPPAALQAITFQQILPLAAERPPTVQLVATTPTPETLSCQFFSLGQEGPKPQPAWLPHATALVPVPAGKVSCSRREPPAEIEARCPETRLADAHYRLIRGSGFQYDAHARSLTQVWWNAPAGEAIGRIQRSPAALAGSDRQRHAVYLDACLQVFAPLLSASRHAGWGTSVLVELAELHLYDLPAPGATLWGHAVLRRGANANKVQGDAFLLDDEGRCFLAMRGLVFQRLEQRATPTSLLYQVQWQPQPRRVDEQQAPASPGRWLVLADKGGIGTAVHAFLAARGETCTLAFAGETYRRIAPDQYQVNPARPDDFRPLLNAILPAASPFRGVVHLWSLDQAAMAAGMSAAAIETATVQACLSTSYLVQALAQIGLRDAPRLWLVTSGVQAITTMEPVQVTQAPLWGLGRTLTHEHAELHCTLLDLSHDPPAEEVASFCQEVWTGGNDEDQVALRGQNRYVARLMPATTLTDAVSRTAAPLPIDGTGTYLITGGLGGLGLVMAQWLVEQGARHLVLVNRRGLTTAEQETAVSAMRAAGARVVIAPADVSRLPDVTALLADLEASLPPLKGIIHAAAVLADGVVLRLTPEQWQTVMQPKAAGAWHLHRLTLDKQLDFFVLFSSAAAVLGSPGASNYAAANAFLDALAYHRRQRGLPALSINWGPWAGLGFAASAGSRLASRGMIPFTPAQGLDTLSQLLRQAPAQVAAIQLDLRQWQQFHPKAAALPLLSQFPKSAIEDSPSATPITRKLQQAIPEQRGALLETHLREQIAEVLKMPVSRIRPDTPLHTLGLDSLMALEFRNRVEASLGLTLPGTLAWHYPTINELVPYLASEMGWEAAISPSPTQARDRTARLAEIEHLSEEEMAARLAQELQLIRQKRSK